MDKRIIWLGLFVGSFIGGLIPLLWGDSTLSLSSIIFSAFGALAGIYLAWRVASY